MNFNLSQRRSTNGLFETLEESLLLPLSMLPADSYDPSDNIPFPIDEIFERLLQSPNSALTPPGIRQGGENGSRSPPQSTAFGQILLPNEFQLLPGAIEPLTNAYLGDTVPQNDSFDALLMNDTREARLPRTDGDQAAAKTLEDDNLRIVAQPKTRYRERYLCESDRSKNRAQRLIRTGNKCSKYEYPTVKFSPHWCDPARELYIQVTPVTTKTEQRKYHCIHPYPIDTHELHVLKDAKNNSLYFRININDFATCEKRFLINRIKMVQNDLRSYGPLRVYGTDQLDDQYTQRAQNAKQIIASYQLWESQLVFTIAEKIDPEQYPVPIVRTEVFSNVMIDVETEERQSANNHIHTSSVLCAPQKAEWQGGDLILLVMPQPIKQRVYAIAFDFGQSGHAWATELTPVDQKTLSFRAPPCPLPYVDGNVQVSMIIGENDRVVASIPFIYITPVETSIGVCSQCEQPFMLAHNSNKRPCAFDVPVSEDGVHSLVTQVEQLALTQEKCTGASRARKVSDDDGSKFDAYLNQLKEALASYIRTNDPSLLLRRTRVLLSKCSDDSPPLHDGIEHGHIPLALKVIEQVARMSRSNGVLEKRNEKGESVLLVGARCNAWEVVEAIVKKRSDVVEDRDVDGNNMLHILASLNDDAGAQTIENLFKILPSHIKTKLASETNRTEQTAQDIAQSRGNIRCVDILSLPISPDSD